jgi:N-methylhydantoinase B/oxoprolinase/acetone carboxylase alpha subunit
MKLCGAGTYTVPVALRFCSCSNRLEKSMSNNLTSAIDRLGNVKAQIAALKKEEDALKAVLIEQGPGAYEGDTWRATVSQSERETLDMVAVREKLSAQFIRAHTNVTPVTTVRVVARTNVKIKVPA